MKPQPFKLIKAPKRIPKPPPPAHIVMPDATSDARDIVRRLVRDMRWDNQGGYPGRINGRWRFVSCGLGQVTPDELDKLFKFAGIRPDEITVVGDCADCANSDKGRERGYSAPCVSCLRPSHINNFVPIAKATKRSKSR